MTAPIEGNSWTIGFATSGFVANYVRIGGTEQTREAIDTSVVCEEGGVVPTQKETSPPGQTDPGELTATFQWDPSFGVYPPIDQPPEVVTVTAPLQGAQATPATESGNAYLTRSFSGDKENGTIVEGEFTLKWQTHAFTAGA